MPGSNLLMHQPIGTGLLSSTQMSGVSQQQNVMNNVVSHVENFDDNALFEILQMTLNSDERIFKAAGELCGDNLCDNSAISSQNTLNNASGSFHQKSALASAFERAAFDAVFPAACEVTVCETNRG